MSLLEEGRLKRDLRDMVRLATEDGRMYRVVGTEACGML